jgi:hypothetical protein
MVKLVLEFPFATSIYKLRSTTKQMLVFYQVLPVAICVNLNEFIAFFGKELWNYFASQQLD